MMGKKVGRDEKEIPAGEGPGLNAGIRGGQMSSGTKKNRHKEGEVSDHRLKTKRGVSYCGLEVGGIVSQKKTKGSMILVKIKKRNQPKRGRGSRRNLLKQSGGQGGGGASGKKGGGGNEEEIN